jgi:hypothetical protein
VQIFYSLRSIVGRLGGGVTNSLQDRTDRDRDQFCEELRQERGLVEATFAFPGWMKRDGNDEIELPAAETRIIQRFPKPRGEGMAQVTLAGVFELVNQTPDESPAPIHRDRAIKVQNPVLAVRAAKSLRDRAGKWLGAFRTKRRHDPRRATLAIGAEIIGALDVLRANHAGGRVEKGDERLENSRRCESQHIVTRF